MAIFLPNLGILTFFGSRCKEQLELEKKKKKKKKKKGKGKREEKKVC